MTLQRQRAPNSTLRVQVPPGAHGEIRTTCPRCSHTRRKSAERCLALNTDTRVFFCHHCGWRGALRGRHHSYTTAPPRRPPRPDARKRKALRRVWRQAQPITSDDPVARYLTRRGLADILNAVPQVLRCHPRLPYRHSDSQFTHHPAMVAAVQNPHGKIVSIHRTYLTHDGRKADVPSVKKLMPAAVPGATRGAAIQLYPAGDTLALAEGIETALAVHVATGLPVWATICAGGMERLAIPPAVLLVVICADHDDAGVQAAKKLARRLLAAGKRVKLLMPATPGQDFADVGSEVRHAEN